MREHKFRRLLKMECCKAMSSPFFLAVLAAGMLFAVLAALYNIGAYRTWMDNVRITGGNPMQQAASLYNHWIGGEAQSLGYTLFYTLLPLLAVFPYGWSYCTERKAASFDKPCGYSLFCTGGQAVCLIHAVLRHGARLDVVGTLL